MRETLERELKLDVEPPFALPALEGEPLPERVFTSTYHDTPPQSLARAGLTLRCRVEDGGSLWQLKLPRPGGARAELEVPGDPDSPPEELARLLQAHLRHGPLEPVAVLRTRRSGTRVLDGERRVADVTVDTVDVLEGGASVGGFVELEAELLDGDENDLERLGRALQAAGAHPSDGRSKLLRVLGLDDMPGAGLAAQLRALEAHDPGVRAGGEPTDVTTAAEAARRASELVADEPLRAELGWLAGELDTGRGPAALQSGRYLALLRALDELV
jgi:inorganic triphosphatase YgiF